jgi:sulfite reductase alpha subunit-like flavoprotein
MTAEGAVGVAEEPAKQLEEPRRLRRRCALCRLVSVVSTRSRSLHPSLSHITQLTDDLHHLLQKKKVAIFYGSQTGTAEDYGIRIAKEIKVRYGLSSLVLDPEE